MTQQISPPTSRVRVHRHNGGAPILAPAGDGWESGVTFNAAVVHLSDQADADRAVSERLLNAAGFNGAAPRELVAVLYRARPRSDPGYIMTRSHVGLALFNPELELLHRFDKPVLSASGGVTDAEYLGVEDPRVTRVGDRFVMVYCGVSLNERGSWHASLCAAESSDLLRWEKRGPLALSCGDVDNKDGVLFPQHADGWHYLLHRPMVGHISQWSIHLARSRSLGGKWEDLGPVMRAASKPGWVDAWIGAGAVPLALGDGRYLEIHHSGHRAADGSRLYTLGAAVIDLNRLDAAHPQRVVESRLDHFMVPETRWEIEGPYPDSVGNVLFTCGAYERDGAIHILYGGGDTYVMAARVAKDELLAAMEPA